MSAAVTIKGATSTLIRNLQVPVRSGSRLSAVSMVLPIVGTINVWWAPMWAADWLCDDVRSRLTVRVSLPVSFFVSASFAVSFAVCRNLVQSVHNVHDRIRRSFAICSVPGAHCRLHSYARWMPPRQLSASRVLKRTKFVHERTRLPNCLSAPYQRRHINRTHIYQRKRIFFSSIRMLKTRF